MQHLKIRGESRPLLGSLNYCKNVHKKTDGLLVKINSRKSDLITNLLLTRGSLT